MEDMALVTGFCIDGGESHRHGRVSYGCYFEFMHLLFMYYVETIKSEEHGRFYTKRSSRRSKYKWRISHIKGPLCGYYGKSFCSHFLSLPISS